MNKYKNKKIVIDNIKFDSIVEGHRYQELKLLVSTGLIKNLELQPKYILQYPFVYKGKKIRAIEYIADFKYLEIETGKTIIEDVKGMETQVFKLKYKLLLKNLMDYEEFRIIK